MDHEHSSTLPPETGENAAMSADHHNTTTMAAHAPVYSALPSAALISDPRWPPNRPGELPLLWDPHEPVAVRLRPQSNDQRPDLAAISAATRRRQQERADQEEADRSFWQNVTTLPVDAYPVAVMASASDAQAVSDRLVAMYPSKEAAEAARAELNRSMAGHREDIALMEQQLPGLGAQVASANQEVERDNQLLANFARTAATPNERETHPQRGHGTYEQRRARREQAARDQQARQEQVQATFEDSNRDAVPPSTIAGFYNWLVGTGNRLLDDGGQSRLNMPLPPLPDEAHRLGGQRACRFRFDDEILAEEEAEDRADMEYGGWPELSEAGIRALAEQGVRLAGGNGRVYVRRTDH